MFGLSRNRRGDAAKMSRRVSLRRSAEAHPMGMFACAVAGAFVFMAIAPAASSVIGEPAAPVSRDGVRTTGKSDRLSGFDACLGQNWSAENEACLSEIARVSGCDAPPRLRMIAQAPDGGTTPHIF